MRIFNLLGVVAILVISLAVSYVAPTIAAHDDDDFTDFLLVLVGVLTVSVITITLCLLNNLP
jgi:hypothetical protein